MHDGVLGLNLYKLYKDNDDAAMTGLLEKSMAAFRDQTLSELTQLMPEVDGKLRLRLLELLMVDGGEDLIPLFMQTLLLEKNALYAKSMLLVFANFQHESALTHLLEVEGEFTGDLKSTYQRVTAKFRARFREHFYMSEFASGNGKRMKFAAKVMLKEPHPSYAPFLTKLIIDAVDEQLTEALQLLEELGDEATVDALFDLLSSIRGRREQRERFVQMVSSLLKEELQEEVLIQQTAAMTDFEAGTLNSLYNRAKRGDKHAFLDPVLRSMDMSGLVADEVAHFYKLIMLGTPLTSPDKRRLRESLEAYGESLTEIMGCVLKTMGRIAARCQIADLHRRIDDAIPKTEPNRQLLIIQVLKGLRSPEALETFCGYLSSSKDPVFLGEVLDAMAEFRDQTPPDVLLKIAVGKHRELRRKALTVIGLWGRGGDVYQTLLSDRDEALNLDGLRLLGQYPVGEALPKLLSFFTAKSPEVQLEAIRASSSYPCEETGRALLPHIGLKAAYEIRLAAIRAALIAGGDDPFGMIIRQLEGEGGRFAELFDSLFAVLQNLDIEHYETSLLRHPEYWEKLLCHPNHRVRDRVLAVLEACTWTCADFTLWLQTFERCIHAIGDARGKAEQKRVVALFDLLRHKHEAVVKSGRSHKMLQEILTSWRSDDDYQRVQALRRLSMAYKPEMIEGRPEDTSQLLAMLGEALESGEDGEEKLKLAVKAAGKVDHPQLSQKLEKLITHSSEAVAQGARKIIAGQAPEPAGEVRSVFILDDSKYMTKQLATVLVKAGYRVAFEVAPRDGLLALSQDSYDLLLLDKDMPEMDGISFLQTARSGNLAPNFTLVMASSREREYLASIVQAGVSGLLFKPFSMNELLEKIPTLRTDA